MMLACNQLTGVDDLEFRDGSPSDMAQSPALPGDCDLLTGGGCELGQTCRFDVETLARVCRPSPLTSLEPYGLCQSDDECPVAHRCQDGICAKVCDSAAECVGSSALCLDQPVTGLGLCTRPCDLVSPAQPRPGLQACGDGARCELVANGSYTTCFGAGSSFDGGPCEVDRDCPASFLCEASRCTRACDASAGSCAAGLACGGLGEYAGQTVGHCCAIPEGHACDLVSNCGCDVGETCDRYDTGGNVCRAIPADPVAAYARCAPGTDCGSGHACVGSSCTLLCKSDADCAGEGELCIETYDSTGTSINAGFRVCARGCDVLAPFESSGGFRACGEGTVCSAYSADAGLTSFCFGAGEVPAGGRCQVDPDCAPGLLCASGACGAPCEPAGTSCGANGVCRVIGERAGEDFGACCTIPEGEVCDLVTDCGCSANEACSASSSEGRVCRPLDGGAIASSAVCDEIADTCPPGHSCLKNGCIRNCNSDADCPGVGSSCIDYPDFGTSDLGFCSTSCNLLDSSSSEPGFEPCGVDLACGLIPATSGDSVIVFTHCGFPGAVTAGGACESFLDCAAGLECYESVCTPSCLSGVAPCDNGAECLVLDPPLIVNGSSVGICDTTP